MPASVNSGAWSRVKGTSTKIDEIANRAGVTVDTVRFYERVGVPSAGTDGVRLSEVRPR
jgi:hypothetical protein